MIDKRCEGRVGRKRNVDQLDDAQLTVRGLLCLALQRGAITQSSTFLVMYLYLSVHSRSDIYKKVFCFW